MDETMETAITAAITGTTEAVYTQADIDAAVSAGVFSRDAAVRLHELVEKRHALATGGNADGEADEEHFRLLNGFNDIFVSIAIVLTLWALWGFLAGGLLPFIVVAAATAVVSWALAEYFTRCRRMALPSIILSLSFIVSVLVLGIYTPGSIVEHSIESGAAVSPVSGLLILAGSLAVAVAAWGHWRRFRVPIDVAAGVGGIVLPILGWTFAFIHAGDTGGAVTWTRSFGEQIVFPCILCAGLCVFALALWWDARDRERVTRRSDVAFWLHLLAAPLIVHPVFHMIGLFSDNAGIGVAIAAIGVYLVLAIVALMIDRRSLLVSALGYMIYAVSTLFIKAGVGLELTALIVGILLLFLSAFWRPVRRLVVRGLPVHARAWLPRT